MKILLIIPRYNLTDKVDFQYVFPLGLGYISSALKKAGYDVDCLNLNHLGGKIEDLTKKSLDKTKYDIVCTGHIGIGYSIIEKITNASRSHGSKPKIILGGTLITSEPELMLDSLKPDFIVIGEGEITIVELLKCIKNKSDFKKVDGIAYIDKDGKAIFTKPRELIKDLDSLPSPDFEGFEFEKYLNEGSVDPLYSIMDFPRTYPILGSRGCPFQCTFCYHSIGERYRTRSVDNIIKEISYAIKKYKINSLFIFDDLFAANKLRLADFCTKLKELTKDIPDFKWSCSLWVSTIDREVLTMVKESGCSLVGLGFESYNKKVLQSMKKQITTEQIDNAIKLCFELQMPITGNFIFGDVAETVETAKETIDFWKENCKGQIQLGFIQPYPGSGIYKHCVRKGIIKDRLDFIKNHIAHTNWLNMTENMTDKEIFKLKKNILEARRKYCNYVIPSKINKINKNRYDMKVKCPFCNKMINYGNVLVYNRNHYSASVICRNCSMRFFVVSRLYKFGIDYYEELDFLRRNYLVLRDKFLRKRI